MSVFVAAPVGRAVQGQDSLMKLSSWSDYIWLPRLKPQAKSLRQDGGLLLQIA
jgi:hypothetical protein